MQDKPTGGTMKTISINDITNEQVGRNLYKFEGKFYRLFGKGVTPNGCWIIAPEMRELKDINVATGKDVYGEDVLQFDGVTGTVGAPREHINF
jgi:hypothetical protein